MLPAAAQAAASNPVPSAAAIQEAFENVRQSLADLVVAKDDRKIDELRFRINTFYDILRFTATEIQDLRVRLLATSDASDEEGKRLWRERSLLKLGDMLGTVEKLQASLNAEEALIGIEEIKNRAQSFQGWRERSYLPVTEEVREYLMVVRQTQIVDTAAERLTRISSDVKRIQRARIKNSASLVKDLKEAETLIQESSKASQEATMRFEAMHFLLPPAVASSAGTSTTTTLPVTPLSATGTASSTGTSTAPLASPPPTPRELVRESLEKIRRAYELFVAMSAEAQKLLN
jgi:hypothetical protein